MMDMIYTHRDGRNEVVTNVRFLADQHRNEIVEFLVPSKDRVLLVGADNPCITPLFDPPKPTVELCTYAEKVCAEWEREARATDARRMYILAQACRDIAADYLLDA